MIAAMKCSCSVQSSKYCIEKKCKNCCNNVECKRHMPQYCEDCGEMYTFNSGKRNALLQNKCSKCIRMCAVCKIKRLDIKCVSRNCKKCCTEKSCKVHLNVNNWCKKCKKARRQCIANNCTNCYCDNTTCKLHYNQCVNCPTMVEKYKYIKCKCCKGCCRNWKCCNHFIVDGDVDFELLNRYKCTLYQTMLPVVI